MSSQFTLKAQSTQQTISTDFKKRSLAIFYNCVIKMDFLPILFCETWSHYSPRFAWDSLCYAFIILLPQPSEYCYYRKCHLLFHFFNKNCLDKVDIKISFDAFALKKQNKNKENDAFPTTNTTKHMMNSL